VVFLIVKSLRSGKMFGLAFFAGITLFVASVILFSYLSRAAPSAHAPILPGTLPAVAAPHGVPMLAWMAVLLAIVVALFTGIVLVTRRTRDMGSMRFALAIPAVLLTIGIGLVGTFGLARQPIVNRPLPPQSPPHAVPQQHLAEPSASQGSESAAVDAARSPIEILEKVYHDSGKLISQKSLQKVPEWTQEPATSLDHGSEQFLVTSQRFATIEEARAAASQALVSQLPSRMRNYSAELPEWMPTLEQIRAAGIIQRECEMTWPIEVGGFTEQVHQVCWQVALSAQSVSALNAAHRPILVQQRITVLAVALGAVTLLFGASALLLRAG
jgi:hypothetical protein